VFTDDIIKSIINKVESEEGVRNLKRGIECIISWINIQKYLENKNNNKNKIIVTNEDVNKYLKSKNNNDSISMMYL
jgi:ATP-dependent Lon protease